MVNSAASQFSIYNFFSVLLPGLLLLVGIYPLLPEDLVVEGWGMVLPVLAVSFAIGQLIHVSTVGVHRLLNIRSHRDRFADEIAYPSDLSAETINSFYSSCREEFPELGLTGDRGSDCDDDAIANSLYVRVRAYVDIHPGGRCQIFQAIYAFCRSTYFMGVVLGFVYFMYGVAILFQPDSPLPYPTKLGIYDFSPLTIWTVVMFLSTTTYYIFKKATYGYRDYFVQYLISEFLIIINNDEL